MAPATLIRCTEHACLRARERHRDLAKLGYRELHVRISSEVGAALRQGRVAKTAPAEVRREQWTTRPKGANGRRFAWTPERDRVYVIRREKGVVLVISTLSTSRTTPP